MGIYSDFTTYFLHFDLSEIIAFARYLPVTLSLPVTSETCPLPLDYSTNLLRHFLIQTGIFMVFSLEIGILVSKTFTNSMDSKGVDECPKQ